MLDTDICSYIIRKHSKNLIKNLIAHQDDGILISSITLTELKYGTIKKGSEQIKEKISSLLKMLPVVAFDEDAAKIYAKIRHVLESSGTPISNMDMLIASCAIASQSILVTNNQKHFSHIKNLKLENWC
jgi:tRNA(fMet)-specific endonuclease VapC